MKSNARDLLVIPQARQRRARCQADLLGDQDARLIARSRGAKQEMGARWAVARHVRPAHGRRRPARWRGQIAEPWAAASAESDRPLWPPRTLTLSACSIAE